MNVVDESSGPGAGSRALQALSRLRWKIKNELFDVFVRAVDAKHAQFEPPDGYEFRFGTAADLERCEPLHTELDARARDHGAQRLAIGHRLVCGLHAELPVFTMWVNPRSINVPGQLKRKLRPDQVFIYKAYTSPEHRGRRLYQAGMAFVLADLAQCSMRELVGYAHTTKAASRAGLDRLGFRSVGTYRSIGYGSRTLIRTSRSLESAFPEHVPRSGLGIE